MTMFPLRLTAITSIKNHSKGIYEERWHVYDLRKESCADGGLGRPILGKTCYFLGLYSKKGSITACCTCSEYMVARSPLGPLDSVTYGALKQPQSLKFTFIKDIRDVVVVVVVVVIIVVIVVVFVVVVVVCFCLLSLSLSLFDFFFCAKVV